MEVSSPTQQRKRRGIAAGVAVVCIFGLVAVYQPTPIADRSNEPLSETASILARSEGERVGLADGIERVADPVSRSELLAAERAGQTAFTGRKREQWRKAFRDGYADGYLREMEKHRERRFQEGK